MSKKEKIDFTKVFDDVTFKIEHASLPMKAQRRKMVQELKKQYHKYQNWSKEQKAYYYLKFDLEEAQVIEVLKRAIAEETEHYPYLKTFNQCRKEYIEKHGSV